MTGAQRAVVARKMHGAENTFVLLDERPPRFEDYAALARTLCAGTGPMDGADGLLVVREAPAALPALAEMLIYNADGSQAEMCGNGVRCAALYLAGRGADASFALATAAGRIGVHVLAREPFAVRVDMGHVHFPAALAEESFPALGRLWRFYDVSLGNPHAVVFVDDVAALDLPALGAAVQTLPRFPAGANLHVVQVEDASTLRVRHFERGVGLTQACGTGAVACAAAAIETRGVRSPVAVRVPGGTLEVAWRRGEPATLRGGAQTLFERTVAF